MNSKEVINKNMKAVIFARVSTQEQTQGESIKGQTDRLLEYCKRKNLQIVKSFSIVESSTKGDRKEFQEVIEFIKKQKQEIALVAEAVDRIQRGFKESVLLSDMIQAGQVCLHFNKENLVINQNSNPSEILRWDFSVLGAKSYALDISHNTKRSLLTKLEKGELTRKAPIGYLNVKNEQDKSHIIIDKSRAFLVKEMFEMYSTGKFAIGDLKKFAQQNNLTNTFFKHKEAKSLSSSVISEMLKNPFYYGEIYVKKYDRFYQHNYEVFITRELFDQCQTIRQTRLQKNNRIQITQQTSPKKEFIFRGLLKCAITGRTISSDIKKSKHTYLLTWNPKDTTKKIWVNEKIILNKIRDIFKSISIPNELLEQITKHLQSSHEAEREYHKHKIEQINTQELKINDKLSELLDMRLEKQISQEMFELKSKRLKDELSTLNAERQIHQDADNNFKNTVSTAFTLASKAYEIFESSKISEKRNLIAFMFSNLKLRGKNLEFTLKKPFDMMVNLHKQPTWLPSNTEFRTYNNSFDGDVVAKNGGLESDSDKITSDDENLETSLEQTDSKTFSNNKNSQIGLSNEIKEVLLNKFGGDKQAFKKVRFLNSLAQTLNDSYSKEVVLFFEDNQALDLSYLKRAY